MAKLLTAPYPGAFTFVQGESWEEYDKRQTAIAATIPWDRVMTFPVADGKACYLVVKEQPLTLQHIPYGDAWHINTAHMRGLRTADWERQKQMTAWFHRESNSVDRIVE